MKYYVIVSVTFIMLATAQRANITIPPRAVNVSINEVAEFNCTAVGNSFAWQANGTEIDEETGTISTPVLVDKMEGTRRSTVRVPVSSPDNAANITCTALSLSPLSSDKSDPVLLMVQGLLESVSDLTVVPINSTTVLISWSPPFTLEGVPILGYNATITNTTSEENETILETAITTMLNYTFSIDHPDPDSEFTVTVVPINEAGPGDNVTTLFSFSFVGVSTSGLSSTPELFQATSIQQDNPTPMISTKTVSVHVKPTLMGSPTNNDYAPLGPITIGGIVGGVILVVLLFVLTPCAVFCVIICKPKYSKMPNTHTSTSSTRRLLSTRYGKGENPYETPVTPHVVFQIGENEETCLSNGLSSFPVNTPLMHIGDSAADIRVDHKEDEHQTTTNNNDVVPQSFEEPIVDDNEGSDQAEHDKKSVTLPEAQSSLTDEKTDTPQSISSHYLKKYQVNDDRLPPTVKAVTVNGEQSDHSVYVVSSLKPVVRRHVNLHGDKPGQKELNYVFVPKESQPEVILLSDQDQDTLAGYSSQSQDADDDKQGEAVLPSLKRTNSQPRIVGGLVENSQPYPEVSSHPFGYNDSLTQIKRYKKKKKNHSDNVEEKGPLLVISETSDDDYIPEVPHECQSDNDTLQGSDESPQDTNGYNQICEQGQQTQIPMYEQVDLVSQENSPAKMDEKTHTHPYERKDFPIQASVTTQPKELHYAELGAFCDPKNRPKPTSRMDPVQYATISPVSHEKMYGHPKRQAKIHGVPSDKEIVLMSRLVAYKWRLVGVQVGVYPAELDEIASEDVYLCSSELFRKWSAGEFTASCPFTWEAVIEILYSESVGESSLAKNLVSTQLYAF